MRIESADLVRYNANERGKNVGDCVKRSLSLALGIPYSEIGKELMNKVKEVLPRSYARGSDGLWKRSSVYDKVIEAHGGTKHNHEEVEITTLEEFVDNVLPKKGTFLITTGSKPGTHNHIVCVIDGKVYDSWDSRNQYVWCYYTFGEDSRVERKAEIDVATLSPDQVESLLDGQDFARRLESKIGGMLHKRGYDDAEFTIHRLAVVNYKISITCEVHFPPFEGQSKWRNYSFKIDIVATPFETSESFAKLVDKAINVRAYDRMYAIFQNEQKEREGYEVVSKFAQYDDEKLQKRLNRKLYMTESERRFYNTLPGWAKALATYISINQPGQFSDSYEMYMIPLPDDPYHAQNDTVVIRGFDANDFRHHLEYYHDTYRESDPNW